MKNPLFSIIIPTYNRVQFLKIAIDSVLAQSFSDYELIIVDDGSDDNTKELINNFNDQRLYYINKVHGGVSSARNAGIKAANGEYIVFLDSDDRFRKDKLQVSACFIKEHPDYKIFHTEEIWYRKGKLLPQKKYQQKPSGYIFPDMLKLCCVSPSTAVIHKSIFSKIGLFDHNLPTCEDYDLWLRISCKYHIFLIPEYLTIKEGGRDDQQSEKYPAIDRFRIYALEKVLKSKRLDKQQYALAYQELQNKCRIYMQGAVKRNKNDKVTSCKMLLETLKPAA
jgi:glycosyltransferase involved in cell wall biosynthesis